MSVRKFPVFDLLRERIPGDVTLEEATRRVSQGKARWIYGGKAIRMSAIAERDAYGDLIPCRTKTAAHDPLRAACGLGQVYTRANSKHQVTGFKRIAVEDSRFFEVLCHND